MKTKPSNNPLAHEFPRNTFFGPTMRRIVVLVGNRTHCATWPAAEIVQEIGEPNNGSETWQSRLNAYGSGRVAEVQADAIGFANLLHTSGDPLYRLVRPRKCGELECPHCY